MSTPYEEAIETFVSITGVSEATAIQKLEEHHGNLNEAVNAYLNESDRNLEASYTAPLGDPMTIDDPIPTVSRRTASLFPILGELNPFSIFDRNFPRSIFDNGTNVSSQSPIISHSREVREIPIEVKDGTGTSGRSAGAPIIEDVTETSHDNDPGVHGVVTIDDDDENDNMGNLSASQSTHTDGYGSTRPSAPTITNEADYNDIEEEMIRAAIEASKSDTAMPIQQYDDVELGNPNVRPLESQHADVELDRAVSLSLQTAEQEKTSREPERKSGDSEIGTLKSAAPEELEKVMPSNRSQSQLEFGGSSISPEADDAEELPQLRRRRRRSSLRSLTISEDAEGFQVSPPLGPQQGASDRLPHHQGNNFPYEEWGGISSEEHDEAVMLEAAMFGGIREGSGYHIPFAPNHLMQNGYSMPAPRPPSPSVTAQRLLREQQDDEYHAALQADREKELKAKEEAEIARAEERRKEDEIRKKQQEEQEIESQLAAKEASLPHEPPKDDENSVTLLVRMPDGNRRGRRFLKSDQLQHLFDFIDVGRGVKPGSYRLVRPYPRRAFGDGESSSTLDELGLTSKQEALYLELI